LFDVSHITAVVTGGGTGIGLMITQYNTGPGSLHALPGDISTKEGAIQLSKDLEAKEPNGIHLVSKSHGLFDLVVSNSSE
jgi:hypothetical protein